MELIVLGLNHNTAPLAIRESFAFAEAAALSALTSISRQAGVCEAVLLSTCNRTEIYAVLDGVEDAAGFLRGLLMRLADTRANLAEIGDGCFYAHQNQACIRHLFRVAASLDSQILGENQILAQVKQAYHAAHKADTTKTVLNILFQRAITAGKKVRSQTRISQNAVSISTAAIELAKDFLPDLSRANILLIGAGKMGQLAMDNLSSRKCKNIYVMNRDYEKALALAGKLGCHAVPFGEMRATAAGMDVIMTSTSSSGYVLSGGDMQEIMRRRGHKPLLLVDIAVPRDIEPEVAQIDGVTLFNIDDLEKITLQNKMLRTQAAALAESLVEKEVDAAVLKLSKNMPVF